MEQTGPVTGSSVLTQEFEVSIDLVHLDDEPITHEDVERARWHLIRTLAGEAAGRVQFDDVAATGR
jgi:ribosomal protein L16/L10AE